MAASVEHTSAVGVGSQGRLVHESGLADARLTGDDDDLAFAGRRPRPCVLQKVQLGVSAEEADVLGHPERGRHGQAPGHRSRRRPRKGGLMGENRLFQFPQGGAGVDAELLDQHPPGVLVAGERLCLSPGAVERHHLLGPEPLPERVLGDEGVELAHRFGVPAQRELGVVQILDRAQAGVLEAHGMRVEDRVFGHVLQRPAPPQREGLAQYVGGTGRGAGGQCLTGLDHEGAEP